MRQWRCCFAEEKMFVRLKRQALKKRREETVEIDLVFKIAGAGIIVAVLNLVLRRAERDEQAMLTTLAGLIVVLMLIIDEISSLFEKIKMVFGL